MTRPLPQADDCPEAARFLEATLLFNLLIHAVAMASMALLLLPGMPGGGTADDHARVAYIGAHPWLWRLGWLPWQLTALADLVLGLALVRTRWIPRLPAVVTVLLTAAAIVPDQVGQFLWITRGVHLAAAACASGDIGPYLAFEGPIFRMVAAWGCLGYLLAALGWTWCFAAARVWGRWMTWLSVATWATFAFSLLAFFGPAGMRPGAAAVAISNAARVRAAAALADRRDRAGRAAAVARTRPTAAMPPGGTPARAGRMGGELGRQQPLRAGVRRVAPRAGTRQRHRGRHLHQLPRRGRPAGAVRPAGA